MSIDWNAFTPWSALAGGVFIGVAAAMFVLLNGRIAGISGILGGLLQPAQGDSGMATRLRPRAGRRAGGVPPRGPSSQGRRSTPAGAPSSLAGLLVGVGTRYGSGCTSGHGVCGLSRLSPRSLAATAAFMGAGFVTVFVVRHLLGI